MIITNLDKRGRITVPPEVLEALGVGPGDLIEYRIEDGQVLVSKGEDEHGPDDAVGDEELQAAIDAVPDDSGPTVSIDEAFSRAYAIIEQHRQRRDAA